jgi:hypothetical protein
MCKTEDSAVPGECRVEGVEINTLHLLFVLLADLKQGFFTRRFSLFFNGYLTKTIG